MRPASHQHNATRKPVHQNRLASAPRSGPGVPLSKRVRGQVSNNAEPYSPPETWHEPAEEAKSGYRIVAQPPGEGYRHVLTPEEIRNRLAALPAEMLVPLQVVQLSRMTRKKQSFPCYGMQWGSSLYLYPIEEGLTEYYNRPPKPAQQIEAAMYGMRWEAEGSGCWKLQWTEEALKDFYLNNILIHELGHLLDDRNSSYVDRERFAEWFAIEHGFKASRKQLAAQAAKKLVRRRHHAK